MLARVLVVLVVNIHRAYGALNLDLTTITLLVLYLGSISPCATTFSEVSRLLFVPRLLLDPAKE